MTETVTRPLSSALPWWLVLALSALLASLLVGGFWLLTSGQLAGLTGGAGLARVWPAARLTAATGELRPGGARAQVRLDAQGQALIVFSDTAFPARDYRWFALAGQGLGRLEGAALLWQTSTPPDRPVRDAAPIISPVRQQALPLDRWSPLWLRLDQRPDWQGEIVRLALALRGAPGSTITLTNARLAPPTLGAALAALLGDWASFQPWMQWSINLYPAQAGGIPGGYRLPLVVAWLAAALGSAFGLRALARRLGWAARGRFDPRVAGGLLLLAWLLLDAPWQWSLLRQLDLTHGTFAGRTSEERAANGPDAGLHALLGELAPALRAAREAAAGPGATRVFVATPDEYVGLRLAYRLYPLNVLWRRHGPELPEAGLLRAGDLILLLNARDLRVDAASGQLFWPDGSERAVELLAERGRAQLLRVR